MATETNWQNHWLTGFAAWCALAVLLYFHSVYWRGEPLEATVIKLAALPPYMMAGSYIHLKYDSGASPERWKRAYFEKHLLTALNLACFFTIFLGQPNADWFSILLQAATFFVALAVFNIFVMPWFLFPPETDDPNDKNEDILRR